MYLVRIDPITRLVDKSPSNSGWQAIKEFSELSIELMTAVALYTDHFSPFQYYSEEDRFAKCLEEIYGDRSKHSKEEVSDAIKKYSELQYNPDLEFIEINRSVRQGLIQELKVCSQEKDYDRVKEISKLIAENKKTTDNFVKDFNIQEAINNSVTENGYELSRIEMDIITRKNSKFVDASELVNPNKLEL